MRTLITLFLFVLFINLQAQNSDDSDKFLDKLRGSSIGLIYTGNSFNVAFKKPRGKNKSLLISGAGIGIRFAEPSLSVTAGVDLHFLKNHYFNDRFFIAHGWGFGLDISTNYNQNVSFQAANLDFTYRVEFNYNLGNNLALGIALNPGIRFQHQASAVRFTQFNYNLSFAASQVGQIQCLYTIPG